MKDAHRWVRLFPVGMLLIVACGGFGPVWAEDPEPTPSAPSADATVETPTTVASAETDATDGEGTAPAPKLGLDSLLTLPSDRTYTIDRRGGQNRGEWRAKFVRARADLAAEHAALEDAERRMDEAAKSGQWQVAPPIPGQGQTPPGETTLDFKTRQEIKRHHREIERLESRLQDLEIEANLAAVPDDWRS